MTWKPASSTDTFTITIRSHSDDISMSTPDYGSDELIHRYLISHRQFQLLLFLHISQFYRQPCISYVCLVAHTRRDIDSKDLHLLCRLDASGALTKVWNGYIFSNISHY